MTKDKIFLACFALFIFAFCVAIGARDLSDDSCYTTVQKITKQADSTGPGQFVLDTVGVAKTAVYLNLKPITVYVCAGDTLVIKQIVKQMYAWAGMPVAKLDSVVKANVKVRP